MNLPPLYSLDNYDACVGRGDKLCTFKGLLSNATPDNALWELIQVHECNKMTLDRTVLHRGICMPKELAENVASQKEYAAKYLAKEIGGLNLTADVDFFTCLDDTQYSTYDYIVLCSIVCYLLFVGAVSAYDWINKNKNSEYFIWNFSIFYNWNKTVNGKNGRDFGKLKCIQGLRVFLMVYTICIHTFLSYMFVYVDDPMLLEQKTSGILFRTFLLALSHLVQPFFLISSLLCTIQIYNLHRDNGKCTFQDILVLILNRYFRFLPSVFLVSVCISTNWVRLLVSTPHMYYILNVFKGACETNMLPTLLFMNNYSYNTSMCNPVTWYLSADFQFYIMTSILVYLIIKYKWSLPKVVVLGIIVSCLLYGATIYALNLDTLYRVSLRSFEMKNFINSVPFLISYSATHTSLTTPTLGMMFGLIYVNYRHKTDLHNNKTLVSLWYLLFYGLMGVTMYLSSKPWQPLTNAILGSILKPMFAFSCGVGILGMSHNIGGILKRVLESRVLEILGKFSFGAYMTHILFCFTRGFSTFDLYPAAYLERDFFIDSTCSFITGAFLALAVELPFSAIQKKILPQIKKKSNTSTETEQSGKCANVKAKIT